MGKKKKSPPLQPELISLKAPFFPIKSVLLLVLFTFFLYGNTLSHEYVLDDLSVIQLNRFVQQGISGIPSIFCSGYLYGFNRQNDQSYRPIPLASIALEKEFFGNKPFAHHLFQIIYYSFSILLLFFFLREIWPPPSTLPLLITLLFTAHPIHTEVVANIKSRDELLCFFFAILSLYTLLRFCRQQRDPLLLLSLVAYFCSCLSKESGLPLLGIIPLTFYFWTPLSKIQIFKQFLPYLFVALLYLGLRFCILDQMTFQEEMTPINNSLSLATSFSDQSATAMMLLGKYLVLLFFPHPLSYDYSYAHIPIVSWSHWKPLLSLVVYFLLGILALRGLWQKKIYSYGIFFFFLMLSLSSNLFILIGATLGERFLFTPSFGFCFLLGTALWRLHQKKDSFAKQFCFAFIIGTILLTYSFKTIFRNADWKNMETLARSGLKTAPESARVHHHYAYACYQLAHSQKNKKERDLLLKKSQKHYLKSLEIYPEYVSSIVHLGDIHAFLDEDTEAIPYYQKALSIDSKNLSAKNNLASLYYRQKNYESAKTLFLDILEGDPSHRQALNYLGAIAQIKRDWPEAISYYEKALQYHPHYSTAYENLRDIYQALGETEKLIQLQKRFSPP